MAMHPDRRPTSEFERVYAAAGDDLTAVPWATLRPLPALVEWLDSEPPGDGRSALVVGCGYGDDAEQLAARGWQVTAFDVSPTAIARVRARFPDSTVDYCAADLFALPARWRRRFELVVEIRTLQAIAVDERGGGADAIAATVAPDGRLWVSILGRDEHLADGDRPWPLVPEELADFERAGLRWRWRRDQPLPDGSYSTDRVYEVIGLLDRS
jgi:SAM-dependent methyltransferase